MAHSNPEILEKLVTVLDDPGNDIYIMLDKKAKLELFLHIETKFSKLIWCKNRISVYWGHVSQIENELNLFEEAKNGNRYIYYHLMSGVDYPIKSQDYIHDFFQRNSGKEFINISDSPNVPSIMAYKLDHYHILSKYYRRNSRIVTGIARRIRKPIDAIQKIMGYKRKYDYKEMKYGSQWCSITHSFVEHLLRNRNKILSEYRWTYCPDEVYKQTLAFNSHFKDKIYEDGNMRLIDWKRGSPYTWTPSDLEEVFEAKELFIRKVSLVTATTLSSIVKN